MSKTTKTELILDHTEFTLEVNNNEYNKSDFYIQIDSREYDNSFNLYINKEELALFVVQLMKFLMDND